jgi:hypothetical protein
VDVNDLIKGVESFEFAAKLSLLYFEFVVALLISKIYKYDYSLTN